MGARQFVSAYWKIILLTLFVTLAVVALFVPGGVFGAEEYPGSDAGNDSAEDEGMTNLVFGLTLDGGTRLSAPVVGMTVEDADLGINPNDGGTFGSDLANELGIDAADTMVRYDEDTGRFSVEVFSDEVTEEEFAAAMTELGQETSSDDVRQGVTQATRNEIVETINLRINEAGLGGGSATQQEVGDQFYIATEVPAMSPEELRSVLSERGNVEVVAHYPDGEGGQENETVLVREDFTTGDGQVSPPAYNNELGHHVPVVVRSETAAEFQQRMNELGFTSEGAGQCQYGNPAAEGQNYCLLTVVDGEVVDAHSMGAERLAPDMQAGTWADSPSFVMGAQSQQDAQSLSINLRAGALRAPLDLANDEVLSIEPVLGQQYKNYSLLIGIVAVFAVSGVVYLRYTDARVALPMIVTALSEVVILLGFAAAAGMSIGLPEVAGFIAVVGTGVDDLIIIADEVMAEGQVNSRKVFASRFQKAFWVIGAAAGTTIVAMLPLAVLNLGDLSGFAIITILGVLIGVLVTRPAYGDILRYLLTER